MHPAFTDTSADAIPIWLFDPDSWADGTSKLSKNTRGFAAALGFSGATGDVVRAPNETGDGLGAVLFGLGAGTDGLGLATLSAALPSGDYEIAEHDGKRSLEQLAAGWADGAYRFQRYKSRGDASPRLVLPEAIDVEGAGREATAVDLVRDLVNTPAEDMGPDGLQEIVSDLAQAHGADFSATIGDELLHAGYPMVHAVGRAAAKAPRMLELAWGDPDAPLLAIVGKGVCFDTGGLNLKTGNYMRDMKKDMGGAAHAIALAGLIMDAGLPVRLKLYVPAVENAVGGGAFRPGDVLKTRKGLIVEIDNTDAEGRLILSDALTKACEDQTPDLLLDYATLTGAARVALGAELAPFYTDDDALAAAIHEGWRASGDPVWRMPLWEPYSSELKSHVADMVNSGGRFAGSITAALFLKRFVDAPRWAHFDIWAWRLAKYGRPPGAAATGLRASWAMLKARYGENDDGDQS